MASVEPAPQRVQPQPFDDYLRDKLAEALAQRCWSEDPNNALPPIHPDGT